MASTFILKSDAYDGRYMRLSCSQSTDIATNTSTISWTLSSIGGSVNYYSTGPTSVVIDGTQVYYCERKDYTTQEFPAAKGNVSGTTEIGHDTNGNKTINISLNTVIYNGAGSAKTYSGTWTLDSIPRQAKILSAPDFNDTQLPTVTYNNPLGSRVQELMICIADNRAYNAYTPYRAINKTGTLSYKFTKADIDRVKKHTTNTLDISFVIRTKISGSYYYSVAYKKFTMTENSDTKPSVSITAALNNSSLPSIFDGMYIQNKSKLNINISATGKYNATITNYSGAFASSGKTYSGASFTTDPFQKSGEVEFVGSARDSRGFTGSASQKFNVIPYSVPYITSFTVERQSDGTTVIAKLKGGVSPIENKNIKVFSVTINGVTQNITTDNYTVDGSTTFLNVPTDNTLTATAEITDAFSTTTKNATLPTPDVTMDFHNSGTGIKFGGVSEKPDLFECDWDVQFNKGLKVDGKTTLSNTLVSDVLAFALECKPGLTPFFTGASTTNLPPNGNYDSSTGVVHKRTMSQINVYLTNYLTGTIAINVCFNGTWKGWKYTIVQ